MDRQVSSAERGAGAGGGGAVSYKLNARYRRFYLYCSYVKSSDAIHPPYA